MARRSAILKHTIMEKLQIYVENFKGGLDYDYDVIIDEDVSTLKHSQIADWAEPGETALTLTDDGNGLIFKFPDRKVIELDYSDSRALLIMLLINMEEKIEIRKSQIIKTI